MDGYGTCIFVDQPVDRRPVEVEMLWFLLQARADVNKAHHGLPDSKVVSPHL